MKAAYWRKLFRVFAALLLVGTFGCGEEGDESASDDPSIVLEAAESWSDWSEPVLLEAVNSASQDANPVLSHDERSLYFTSNRAGGLGGNDLWVVHRKTKESSWGAPVNLGSPVNSDADDQGPSISKDDLMLVFLSTRSGGFGALDVYVCRRKDAEDDFAWGAPENLGADVNTSGNEFAPHFQEKGEGGKPTLYFARGMPNDILAAPMSGDGTTLGPAVPVAELNTEFGEAGPSVRKDGLEMVFQSVRTGTLGLVDIWVSTRASVHDAWSAPVNLGSPVNSTVGDFAPALSFDGRTLLFTSDASRGGLGGQEIWISTRTPIDDD